jgi:hypothetical protein
MKASVADPEQGARIRDPVCFLPLDPEWKKILDPGYGIDITDHISKSLVPGL